MTEFQLYRHAPARARLGGVPSVEATEYLSLSCSPIGWRGTIHMAVQIFDGDRRNGLTILTRNDGRCSCVRNESRSITIGGGTYSTRNVEHGAHDVVSFATSMLDKPDVIEFMQRANKSRLNL